MHPFIIVRETLSVEALKFHLESDRQDYLFTFRATKISMKMAQEKKNSGLKCECTHQVKK